MLRFGTSTTDPGREPERFLKNLTKGNTLSTLFPSLLDDGDDTLGCPSIRIGAVLEAKEIPAVTINHRVNLWGYGFYATPAQAREIAAEIIRRADEVDSRTKPLPAYGVGAVFEVPAYLPFLFRSDKKWVGAGLSGPKHADILDLIAEAHREGSLKIHATGNLGTDGPRP